MNATNQPTPDPSKEGNYQRRTSATRAPLLGGAGGGFALVLSIFFLLPFGVRAATNELSTALQTGLFEEEANRNLPAAIEAYEKVAKQFDQNRALAATAIFRLGEVNRKLGKTNEAAAFYQRILREFTDQDTLATLSRQNLAGMGVNSVSRPANPTGSAQAVEAQAEISRQEAQLTILRKMDRKQLLQVLPTVVHDAMFDELQKQLNLAQQAFIKVTGEHAPPSPTYITAQRLVDDQEAKLNGQADGILIGLAAQVEVAKAALAGREKRQTGDGSAGSATPIATVLDEEETEIRRIQAMIQNSPDLINAPGEEGTPLYRAASKGQLRVATFLLDHGADINTRAGMRNNVVESWTPLYAAANQGHRAMVELLAVRGADMNAKVELGSGFSPLGSRSSGGRTALHRAVEKGFQAVVEALLANKADINARDKSGGTPLHLAASKGHPGLTAYLLSKGADMNATIEDGGTPLMGAASGGHSDTLKQLIAAKASINVETTAGRTALSLAAEGGHLDSVMALLAAKADPNAGKVNLPLHCAIMSKSTGIVEALLKAGADANRTSGGYWPINGSPQTFGLDVSPLALAVREPQLDIIKLLLANKADPNGKRVDGVPLIFSAVNDPEMTKAFLDAGAKPNVVDAGDPPRSPLYLTSNPKVISLLLAAGADPEARLHGMTRLMWAVNDRSTACAEALLAGGAKVNATGPDGSTALHIAVRMGSKEIIALLLEHKADVNARENQGLTPLDYATGKGQPPTSLGGFGIPLPPPGLQPQSKPDSTPVAELLRQHGGLADLPKLDRIELVRPGSFRSTVLVKSANGWNQFTLIDALFANYGRNLPPSHKSSLGSAFDDQMRRNTVFALGGKEPPFPDLHRIVVIRQQAGSSSKPAERITVDLLNATNGVDCAKDIALNFGDVVEIPERLHTLQETAVGLTPDEMGQIIACRKGVVTLVYQGKKTSLAVGGSPGEALISSILAGEESRKALFSSADLSRVKVTRHESPNAKPREWIVDCSKGDRAPSPDLWLRDGDVIEVPEK